VSDDFDLPEERAALNERVNEAGLKAERLYERIVALERDEAVELLRAMLRDTAEVEELWALARAMLVDHGLYPPEGAQ
jgi:hypothetical protein